MSVFVLPNHLSKTSQVIQVLDRMFMQVVNDERRDVADGLGNLEVALRCRLCLSIFCLLESSSVSCTG